MSTLERPLERFGVAELRRSMTTFGDLMRAHEVGINRLNVYPVPDGDTGTNMARTLDAVVTEMESAPDELAATCDAISHGSLMGARGNSGVILSQILRGIAATFKDAADVTATTVADALQAASDAAYRAVLRPVEGTILTVVRESAAGARAAADGGASAVDTLRAARDAGRSALERTPELLPVLQAAGVVDAGGAGYLLLLDAVLHVVDDEPLPEPTDGGAGSDVLETLARHATGVDIDSPRYEVMFLCALADECIEDFKERWGAIGDSIVVVGGDGTWNCHIHTDDIGAAVETALDLGGRPSRIRVTDLFEEIAVRRVRPAVASVPVTCAVVAVSSGAGIAELFRQLGVQAVVMGGQTMNPSTAELLAAVDGVNSDQVVVLPGNANIIPVAEQLDALTAKAVRVVPTRSMPEGLAALVVYDPEAPAEANTSAMRHAAEAIVSGEVTQAVRASQTDAGRVAEGDWLGIARGEGIVAASTDPMGAVAGLLEHLVTEDRELVTVIVGADADEATTGEITAWLAQQRPGVDVEVHDGGQPLYPYLFGVE